ncbi:citrate lyase subunit beta/citryl-CoA lyase [Rhizobium sp. SG_E_25_P2]|uniref:HpcH/HpaI aldolase/citrate lyase family protein n=1 Tax=Rhizobium sp. SG_E_25_P2 TaxID=2879942 RepID=UPI00247387A2|nr:CoA ester lyase [Rhizobium sp. SG_E_25_P2]MDH6267620.1 citrate lyase subunit beta/citryl-CoA lyase [Rhizobium sp. SG_E_25_P2]
MTQVFRPPRPSRSLLCLPGSNERAIAKLPSLAMDGVILDLEDAVADSEKDAARDKIRAFFEAPPIDGVERIIRINDVASRHAEKDLALVLETSPDAVLIPKVRSPSDILDVVAHLSDNDAAETIRIWAMMETPLSILNAGAIAETGRTAGGRLDALVVGLNDLRKDTGVLPDLDRTFVTPWLMQVVLAGRAYGLRVIDAVCNEFRDLERFDRECATGRAMGFDGKMLIHPAQIPAANSRYRPSPVEIAEAEEIIAGFSAPGADQLNALDIGGRMVERLHYEQALALKARADLIARRDP